MFNKFLYDDINNIDFKRLKLIVLLIIVTIVIIIIGNILLNATKKETITFTLNGEEEITIKQNERYSELGVIAHSSKYGDISSDINISGNVNAAIVGVYYITYTLIDYADYSVTRQVKVIANETTDSTIATHTISNSIYTKNVIDINLNIKLNNYKYTLLPNNTKNFSKSITYSVTTNDNYTFNVYDNNNIAHKYEVSVANIDKTEPFASCTAIALNNEVTITVSASDNGSGIAGYSYALTGDYTDYMMINKYTFSGTAKTAYIKVKDSAGNIKSISCIVNNSGSIVYKPPFVYDNSKPLLKCDSYTQIQWQELESQLNKAVDSAGRGTRAGAVAAARFLAGLPYSIPYRGLTSSSTIGQYPKLGFNSDPDHGWGCYAQGRINGFDCSSYMSWALINGGLEGNLQWTNSYSGVEKILDVVNQIKVGDFALHVDRTGERRFSHVGMIIGIDANYFYVAEERGNGLIVTPVSKTVSNNVFTYVKLSHPYPSDGNITNMW